MFFKVKAELALYEALQRDGRLSEVKLAEETGISPTTVHYALDRIRSREIFKVQAVPVLEKFSVPMAIIGFSNVHPVKIKELEEKYAGKPEVVQLYHSEKDVVMILMDADNDKLTKKLFAVMELVGEKPSVYMTAPKVAKFSAAIPEKVLEAVFSELPDRRFSV